MQYTNQVVYGSTTRLFLTLRVVTAQARVAALLDRSTHKYIDSAGILRMLLLESPLAGIKIGRKENNMCA